MKTLSKNNKTLEIEQKTSIRLPIVSSQELGKARVKQQNFKEVDRDNDPYSPLAREEILPEDLRSQLELSEDIEDLDKKSLMKQKFMDEKVIEIVEIYNSDIVKENSELMTQEEKFEQIITPMIDECTESYKKIEITGYEIEQEIEKVEQYANKELLNNDSPFISSTHFQNIYGEDAQITEDFSSKAQKIFDEINRNNEYGKFKILVVENVNLNETFAFSVGGGKIYLTKELYENFKNSPETLQSILAHETAHDLLEHLEKMQKASEYEINKLKIYIDAKLQKKGHLDENGKETESYLAVTN